VAVVAALAIAVAMLLPRGVAEPQFSSAGPSLERLAALIPAFARPAREGDRPRWPGAQRGEWRLLGRAEGRRGWLGLVPASAEDPESLCFVADWKPWAQEAVECRPAAGRLGGLKPLGVVTHEEGRRATFAMAVVPPRSDFVVFVTAEGRPLRVRPTADGLVGRGAQGGLRDLQFKRPDGVLSAEPFAFREPGVPPGLVDSYAAWRREQSPADRLPANVPARARQTWRRIGGAPGVRQWMGWEDAFCVAARGSGATAVRCVAQDEGYGGVVTSANRMHVFALPDRVRTVDIVREDGSGDRYEVEENGAAVPARSGDRVARLLDANGGVLKCRDLRAGGVPSGRCR
jgi:hypothetical protein